MEILHHRVQTDEWLHRHHCSRERKILFLCKDSHFSSDPTTKRMTDDSEFLKIGDDMAPILKNSNRSLHRMNRILRRRACPDDHSKLVPWIDDDIAAFHQMVDPCFIVHREKRTPPVIEDNERGGFRGWINWFA